jgi:Calx-beta domain/Carboxypeptidase regulatory-like domain/WD40-like Beta Propeller Repeat
MVLSLGPVTTSPTFLLIISRKTDIDPRMRKLSSPKVILLQAVILLSCSFIQAQTNSGKLVYADEPGRIQIINADGTGQTKLTLGETIIDDDPVYSPDGSRIAFGRRSGGKSEICIVNADGTNVVTVATVQSLIHDRDPSWSPDGTKLVFTSNRSGSGKTEIWTSNIDGSGLIRLTTSVQLGSDGQGPIFSSDTDPAWSPDGSKIAFVSTRDGLSDSELYVMNPDGSNPVRLTNDGLDDSTPAWSPDSQRIAFAKSNRAGIHIINRDGTNLVNVLSFGFWPAWSPDGSRLAFVELDSNNNFRGNIFIANTDGTGKLRVTDVAEGARAPSWALSSSPPIPTFTISGVVKDTNGVPISGATLTKFTIPVRTTQSDATGAYSFTGLPAGTYRIEISKPGYGFLTPGITVSNVNSDRTANFTGFVAFSISGTVSGANPGLPVTLTGSESRSVFTDLGGVYSFNVLPAGGNYTVSINSPFVNVTPGSISFNNLSANQIANFEAVIARYTISGTVTRLGLPKSGIPLRLRDTSGFEPPTTTSDANGHYAFTNVIAGRSYSVELAAANYLADSKGFPALDGNKTADFQLRSANNILLERATVTVVEGTPSLQIRVVRGGNASGVGPITIDYATADGTAQAGLDYTAVTGTLDFPEGTFSRTITVPILNDQALEGAEQFSITLSKPTGEVDLATPSTAVVTIADNEVRLITQSNSDRAIALNAMTLVAEPFSLTTETNFSTDHRTRISLFVEDLRVFQTFPPIFIDAVDAQQNHFLLPLEVVVFNSRFPFQQLIVRLPENLSTGELFVTISVNGSWSNTARFAIKP